MDFGDFVTWLAGAVVVVGLVQWIKGLVRDAPSWVWAIVMAGVSIGVGYAMPSGGIYAGLGTWAIAQLGYDAILKGVIAAIERKSAAKTESSSGGTS